MDTGDRLSTSDGVTVEIWELQHVDDAKILTAWAKHFREHYCADPELDKLRKGTGLSREEFLRQMKFPDAKKAPGPSTRAGDFAEILAADFIEFELGFWCPRERWSQKWIPNESAKGSDVVGFKFVEPGTTNKNDEMLVLESKADMSGNPKNRLQEAVNDSAKDPIRHGMTLNALKQRFIARGENESATKVERFQNRPDNPFLMRIGAIAVIAEDIYDPSLIEQTTTNDHPYGGNLMLVVVTGKAFMDLVHALYDRAANEA